MRPLHLVMRCNVPLSWSMTRAGALQPPEHLVSVPRFSSAANGSGQAAQEAAVGLGGGGSRTASRGLLGPLPRPANAARVLGC